jgi:plastocyanin
VHRIERARLWTLALPTLLIVGCGSASHAASKDTRSATQAASQTTTNKVAARPSPRGTSHVMMRALWFYPTRVYVRVGQRVIWTNDDSSPHNVTYVSGPRFRSSRRIMPPGAKFGLTVSHAGTIHYYCSLHPWMKATIVVAG